MCFGTRGGECPPMVCHPVGGAIGIAQGGRHGGQGQTIRMAKFSVSRTDHNEERLREASEAGLNCEACNMPVLHPDDPRFEEKANAIAQLCHGGVRIPSGCPHTCGLELVTPRASGAVGQVHERRQECDGGHGAHPAGGSGIRGRRSANYMRRCERQLHAALRTPYPAACSGISTRPS